MDVIERKREKGHDWRGGSGVKSLGGQMVQPWLKDIDNAFEDAKYLSMNGESLFVHLFNKSQQESSKNEERLWRIFILLGTPPISNRREKEIRKNPCITPVSKTVKRWNLEDRSDTLFRSPGEYVSDQDFPALKRSRVQEYSTDRLMNFNVRLRPTSLLAICFVD